jgi:hypothetical protein
MGLSSVRESSGRQAVRPCVVALVPRKKVWSMFEYFGYYAAEPRSSRLVLGSEMKKSSEMDGK